MCQERWVITLSLKKDPTLQIKSVRCFKYNDTQLIKNSHTKHVGVLMRYKSNLNDFTWMFLWGEGRGQFSLFMYQDLYLST